MLIIEGDVSKVFCWQINIKFNLIIKIINICFDKQNIMVANIFFQNKKLHINAYIIMLRIKMIEKNKNDRRI